METKAEYRQRAKAQGSLDQMNQHYNAYLRMRRVWGGK